MQFIKNGVMVMDTGLRSEPQSNPMILLEVRHDAQPENEIFINCDSWCDLCSRRLPEWKMTNLAVDQGVCEDCYENFN